MVTTDDIRFFMMIARAGSLASAARQLGVTAPAVTQRLKGLERRLGVRLLDRSGQRIALTADGELLTERGRIVLDGLDDLSEALAERRCEMAGPLRVVAPFGFGRRYLAPIAASFQRDHPRVRLDLWLSDRPQALAGDWDVAVHVGDPERAPAALVSRTLAPNDRILCAAPEYLATHGMPSNPAELSDHACLALRENDEDVTLWRFQSVGGAGEQRIRINPYLASNDGEVIRRWALDGHGIMVRSEWDIADDLQAGRLVALLTGYILPDAPVVALLSGHRRSRTVRTNGFLDRLASELSPAPWRR